MGKSAQFTDDFQVTPGCTDTLPTGEVAPSNPLTER